MDVHGYLPIGVRSNTVRTMVRRTRREARLTRAPRREGCALDAMGSCFHARHAARILGYTFAKEEVEYDRSALMEAT